MSDLAERLARVRERMTGAAVRAGRAPESVRLIAVGKTFGPEPLVEAARAGAVAFGENRVQEAASKIPVVSDRFPSPLEWHLIGSLQRNKARRAVELFDVIHSVDRLSLVDALGRAAGELARRPRVLVQVNVDAEEQKAGVSPEDAADLVAAIDRVPELDLVGLMAIPRVQPEPEATRPAFARLRGMLEDLNRERTAAPPLRELSMGMTADFEVAIEEGATWVRVGTAIFGERAPR